MRSSRPLGTAAANYAVPWKVGAGFQEEVTADGAALEGGKVPGAEKTHLGKAPTGTTPRRPPGAAAVPGPDRARPKA